MCSRILVFGLPPVSGDIAPAFDRLRLGERGSAVGLGDDPKSTVSAPVVSAVADASTGTGFARSVRPKTRGGCRRELSRPGFASPGIAQSLRQPGMPAEPARASASCQRPKQPAPKALVLNADERTRTSTWLPRHGPEPCASTNSATSAYWPGRRRYRTTGLQTSVPGPGSAAPPGRAFAMWLC